MSSKMSYEIWNYNHVSVLIAVKLGQECASNNSGAASLTNGIFCLRLSLVFDCKNLFSVADDMIEVLSRLSLSSLSFRV